MLLFIFVWTVFVAPNGLSLVVVSRGFSLLAVRGLLLVVVSLIAERVQTTAVNKSHKGFGLGSY